VVYTQGRLISNPIFSIINMVFRT